MTTHTNEQEDQINNEADIELSKPSKARFMFLLSFFGYFIFLLAGCYNLYEHHYQKNDNTVVPDNTLYEPKYH